MKTQHYFIGVDVGTASVRTALFNTTGKRLAMTTSSISIFKPQTDFVEQSSDQIWIKTCACIKELMHRAQIDPSKVVAIGFDATCSLVALDEDDMPASVSPTGNDAQNIIMWMDHRATEETAEINATGNEVLKYVGGALSPEMEIPKILWLKRNAPAQYAKIKSFFDLPDFLVYKASGNDVRSTCTKVCKWTYLAHEKRWSEDLFKAIDLEDLFTEKNIGKEIRDLGDSAGHLCEESAAAMGLTTDTIVAVGIIDAHAGGLGLLGSETEGTLALIGGTSSCHMAVSKEAQFIEGIWGPYFGAMLPGYWLSEGGQSATGALIDHVIQTSALYPDLKREAVQKDFTVYELLNEEVARLRQDKYNITQDYHVLGYFHGNRSPRANPMLRGMVSGIALDSSKTELAKLYLATIQSIAYGTRHIIETMNDAGHNITKIHVCGGGTKNPLWLSEHATICNCDVVLAKEPEAVLLGAAILAATASNYFISIADTMQNMTATAQVIKPEPAHSADHEKKYQVFLEMYEDQMKYKNMME